VEVKHKLTIQLDDEVIGRAKILAAEPGTSVSGLGRPADRRARRGK